MWLQLQLILYESIVCDVTPKVMTEVLILRGLIISHDLSAHIVHVKAAGWPTRIILALDNCQ